MTSSDAAGEDEDGWLNRLLADEETLDRPALWRLGTWGAAAVGSLVVAMLAAQTPGLRRDTAAANLAQQSQQIQWIANESQNRTRQLAAAIDTLNSDRDRLYARVTVLEQGLESVTGSLARASAPAAPQASPSAPSAPPSAAEPAPRPDAKAEAKTDGKADARAESKTEAKAETKAEAKPDPAALPRIEPASAPRPAPVATVVPVAPAAPPPSPTAAKAAEKASYKTADLIGPPAPPAAPATTASVPPPALARPEAVAEAVPDQPVQRTEFGVDVGGARSVEGLRALWRGLSKSHAAQLHALRPIIAVKERHDGLGMQLRLVAGPVADAAAAAKICAALIEANRACETTVFDGQRLALDNERKPEGSAPARRKARARPSAEAPPAPEPQPARSSSSSFGALFGLR